METQFSDRQLSHIIDQALIYQCACPAQVAKHLIGMRDLYEYQQNCLSSSDTDRAVHERIAADALQIHATLEACLEAILRIEAWDMKTLTMPKNLQKIPRVL